MVWLAVAHMPGMLQQSQLQHGKLRSNAVLIIAMLAYVSCLCRQREKQGLWGNRRPLSGGLQHQQEPDMPGASHHGACGGPAPRPQTHTHPLQRLPAYLPATGSYSCLPLVLPASVPRACSCCHSPSICSSKQLDVSNLWPRPLQECSAPLVPLIAVHLPICNCFMFT